MLEDIWLMAEGLVLGLIVTAIVVILIYILADLIIRYVMEPFDAWLSGDGKDE